MSLSKSIVCFVGCLIFVPVIGNFTILILNLNAEPKKILKKTSYNIFRNSPKKVTWDDENI